jgi:tyrosyl-tRNA synthetase
MPRSRSCSQTLASVASQSEGRRAIAQGGVSLDNVRIDDETATIEGRVPRGGMAVLRRGKKTLAGIFVE